MSDEPKYSEEEQRFLKEFEESSKPIYADPKVVKEIVAAELEHLPKGALGFNLNVMGSQLKYLNDFNRKNVLSMRDGKKRHIKEWETAWLWELEKVMISIRSLRDENNKAFDFGGHQSGCFDAMVKFSQAIKKEVARYIERYPSGITGEDSVKAINNHKHDVRY